MTSYYFPPGTPESVKKAAYANDPLERHMRENPPPVLSPTGEFLDPNPLVYSRPRTGTTLGAGRVDDYNRMVSGIPGFPSFNAARTVGGQTLGSMPSGNAGLSSDAMTPEGQQMLANIKLPEYRVPPPADMQPQQRFNPYQQLQQFQQQQRFNPYQQQQQFNPYQQFQQPQFNPYQQFQQPQFNPFMGGLGGLFGQMGGYGMGYNPMMGGFGGGFNPMMGGGFGGGQGFGGFGGGMQQGGFGQPQGGSIYGPQGSQSPFGGGFGGGFGSRGYMNQMGGSAPAGQAAGFGMY